MLLVIAATLFVFAPTLVVVTTVTTVTLRLFVVAGRCRRSAQHVFASEVVLHQLPLFLQRRDFAHHFCARFFRRQSFRLRSNGLNFPFCLNCKTKASF
jgi:hypothetical protein